MGEEKAGGAARGSPEVVRVLKKARALVKKGWAQGSDSTLPGRVCAGIALERSALPDAFAERQARHYLCRIIGVGPRNVMDWNDARVRTKAEVLAAFDRAIELASNASAPKEPPEPTPDPEAQRG